MLKHPRLLLTPSKGPALLCAALLSTAGVVAGDGLAQQAAKLDLTTFPPNQVFRTIQLSTVACGRDNTAEPCEKARNLADPLMDHPKLPAACKDTLWDIRERAVVAPKNSYDRREALNRDSIDLIALCKPATKPVGSGGQAAKPEEKKPGGLGGFLRGLGIGGGGGNP